MLMGFQKRRQVVHTVAEVLKLIHAKGEGS